VRNICRADELLLLSASLCGVIYSQCTDIIEVLDILDVKLNIRKSHASRISIGHIVHLAKKLHGVLTVVLKW